MQGITILQPRKYDMYKRDNNFTTAKNRLDIHVYAGNNDFTAAKKELVTYLLEIAKNK